MPSRLQTSAMRDMPIMGCVEAHIPRVALYIKMTHLRGQINGMLFAKASRKNRNGCKMGSTARFFPSRKRV